MVGAVLLLSGCLDGNDGSQAGGDSHFLQGCQSDMDCVEALSCICGTCTHGCADDASCQLVDPAMHCAASDDDGMEAMCGALDTPVTLCVALCDVDDDCAHVGETAACDHGLCVVP